MENNIKTNEYFQNKMDSERELISLKMLWMSYNHQILKGLEWEKYI